MTSTPASRSADEMEIRALIRSQFDAIDWDPGRDADWRRLYKGFMLGAQLWPARRPAAPQSALDFATRLQRLRAEGTLESFSEKGVGCEVFVVGNAAIAAAGCEMTGNAGAVKHDVRLFLLVKDTDGWRIAAQAWDVVDDIPAAFAAAGLRLDP